MSDLATFFGAGFDTSSVKPADDFQVLPPGKYPVLVESAEIKTTKAGSGAYIKLVLVVLDGPSKNRKLFDQINIANPSQQCVNIGLRTLAALGQAIGLVAISDTTQLVGKACLAHVKVKEDRNNIRTYSKFDDAASVQRPAHVPPPPVQYQPPAEPRQGNGKPPWAR